MDNINSDVKWRKNIQSQSSSESRLEDDTKATGDLMTSRTEMQIREKVNYGVLFSLLAGICHALSALVEKLVPGVTLLQYGFYRSLLVAFMTFLYLKVVGEKTIFRPINGPNTTKLLFLRGLVLTTGGVLTYHARKHLPLGDTSALTGTSTVITGILGLLFLGESWHILECFLSLFCLIGVVLMSRPSFIWDTTPQLVSRDRTSGVIAALCAATCQSIAMLLVRYLSRSLEAGRLVFFAFSIAAGMFFVAMVTVDGFFIPNFSSWKYIFLSGIIATIGHVLVSKGLKLEKAAPAAVAKSSGNVVTSFLFQMTIFGNVPSTSSVVGASLIFLSATILSWIKTKRKEEKKQ